MASRDLTQVELTIIRHLLDDKIDELESLHARMHNERNPSGALAEYLRQFQDLRQKVFKLL